MEGIPRVNNRRMTIYLKSNEPLIIRYPHSMDDQRDLVKESFHDSRTHENLDQGLFMEMLLSPLH